MEPVAHAGCIFKVNAQCDSCKLDLLEVVHSINGAYSVSIDGELGTAKVSGEVNPALLLHALSRPGRHAELKTINLRHPSLSSTHHHHRNTNYYDTPPYYHMRSRRLSSAPAYGYSYPHARAHLGSSSYYSHHHPFYDDGPSYSNQYGAQPLSSYGYGHGYGHGHHNCC